MRAIYSDGTWEAFAYMEPYFFSEDTAAGSSAAAGKPPPNLKFIRKSKGGVGRGNRDPLRTQLSHGSEP
jgi:hypothetical protein